MRVLITGASGFIGGYAAAALLDAGHEVEGLQRDVSRSVRAGARTLSVPVRGALRTDAVLRPDRGAGMFAGADAVIHLVHDKELTEAGLDTFTSWYDALERTAARSGARQIYVSSYSARPDAVSVYGRAKYRVERFFLERGHSIVRPGLVLGAGGIFGRIMGIVRRVPVVPVPGGSRDKMPYVSVRVLGAALEKMVAMPAPPSEVNAFGTELSDLPALLRAAARMEGLRRWFVPVPVSLALAGLLTAERCGLRLPVTSDNLRGTMVNQAACHFSNLRETLGMEESVEQAVRAALEK